MLSMSRSNENTSVSIHNMNQELSELEKSLESIEQSKLSPDKRNQLFTIKMGLKDMRMLLRSVEGAVSSASIDKYKALLADFKIVINELVDKGK